jgi:hypothetical protein
VRGGWRRGARSGSGARAGCGAGHDAAQAGDSTAYGQWELRQLEAFAAAVGMDDAAEGLAVATYLLPSTYLSRGM